ncbi:hypothetical protein [Geodermatophilus poikilotrophus]|uniref:Uncharacterized protein n=1 Tax=Geodermatophilus poikilotrophus TaxID=1333667 RepID=A0A1I0EQM2_9ACTN|nr:hypothetical protein [Geodermatophilus poikilotrophus]SET47343.1 hypothetical protein SAMN04488546_2511 [Geodermatophilus poikilotrophus]
MKDLRSSSILTTTGVVAGALGAAVVSLSLIFAFGQMGPNLLSEAAGLLLGVALAVLIIDRVTARQRQREWRFAHDIVARRLAASVVDAVRLLSIRQDKETYAAHRPRFAEFADLCQLHFGDLDSNIAASVTVVEPQLYERSREIQLHLSVLIRTLKRRMGHELTPIAVWELQLARHVAQMAMDYMQLEKESAARDASNRVLRFLESTQGQGYWPSTVSDVLSNRFNVQTSTLHKFAPDRRFGIIMDADLDLAVWYFTIDWWLLSRLGAQAA